MELFQVISWYIKKASEARVNNLRRQLEGYIWVRSRAEVLMRQVNEKLTANAGESILQAVAQVEFISFKK